MKVRVAEPSRGLGVFGAIGHVRGNLFSARVVKAPALPLLANGEAIQNKVRDVSAPHFDGGVIRPPIIRDS